MDSESHRAVASPRTEMVQDQRYQRCPVLSLLAALTRWTFPEHLNLSVQIPRAAGLSTTSTSPACLATHKVHLLMAYPRIWNTGKKSLPERDQHSKSPFTQGTTRCMQSLWDEGISTQVKKPKKQIHNHNLSLENHKAQWQYVSALTMTVTACVFKQIPQQLFSKQKPKKEKTVTVNAYFIKFHLREFPQLMNWGSTDLRTKIKTLTSEEAVCF